MRVQQPGSSAGSLVKQVAIFAAALSAAAVLGVVLANGAAAWTLGGTALGGVGKSVANGSKSGSSRRPGSDARDTGRCIPCEEKNPPTP
jgi:hypothetical protein